MKKENGLTVLGLIIIIVVLIVAIILAIFFIGQATGNQGGQGGSLQAKSDNYSPEELVDFYAKGIENADYQTFLKAWPESMRAVVDYTFRGETGFKEECNDLKEAYGADLKVTFNITNKEEESAEWIQNNQAILKRETGIDVKINKAYALEGTMTMSGSRKTETRDIEELWYCDIDGKWGLIGG